MNTKKLFIILLCVVLAIAIFAVPTNVYADQDEVSSDDSSNIVYNYNDLGAMKASIDLTNGKTYEMVLTVETEEYSPGHFFDVVKSEDVIAEFIGLTGVYESIVNQEEANLDVFCFKVNSEGCLVPQIARDEFDEELGSWFYAQLTEPNEETLFKATRKDDGVYELSAVKSSETKETYSYTEDIVIGRSGEYDEETGTNYINADRYTPVEIIITYGKAEEATATDTKEESKEETTTIVVKSENAAIVTQFNSIVEKLRNNEEVEGISEELAMFIANAIEEGKEVTVDNTVKEVSKEDVAEDAEKVEALVPAGRIILSYFDINLEVTIDGAERGKITKVDEGIEVTIPVPENIPAVANGYTRIYKIVRVHDGVAEELDATEADGNLKFTTDRFSTYAVTYEDVKTAVTPATGDNIAVYITLFVVAVIAMVATIVLIRRKK